MGDKGGKNTKKPKQKKVSKHEELMKAAEIRAKK